VTITDLAELVEAPSSFLTALRAGKRFDKLSEVGFECDGALLRGKR